MKKLFRDKIRVVGLLSIILFTLSLIPIVYASFYSHATLDDYGYSAAVHQTVLNGGNILDVLSAAAKTVKSFYQSWQGTYSAIFLFSLQPGAFGFDLYFLTTFIMLGILITGVSVLAYTVLVKWLRLRRAYVAITVNLLLTMMIQFVPSKKEAFFWYNGSVYYTFFFGLALIFFSFMIRILLADQPLKQWLHTVLAAVFAMIIAGGNYTTGLTCLLILALFIFVLAVQKNKKALHFSLIFIVLLSGFAISMTAPGNSVRAAAVSGMGPVKAVLESLKQGLRYLYDWTRLPQLAGFLFLSPLIYIAASKSKFRFRLPGVVIPVLFGVFSAQFTPALYAMSSLGGGQQINIYYYSYYLFILIGLFYLFGFINRKIAAGVNTASCFIRLKQNLFVYTGVFAIVFFVGCFGYRLREMTSVQTGIAIKNHTVQEYDREFQKQHELLSSDVRRVTIENIKTVPPFFQNIGATETDDVVNYWINIHLERFYGKEKVLAKSK